MEEGRRQGKLRALAGLPFDWGLDEVKALHLDLSREMKREVRWMRRWDESLVDIGARGT